MTDRSEGRDRQSESRRLVLRSIAGATAAAGAGGTAWLIRSRTGDRGPEAVEPPPPPPNEDRAAAYSPADAGGFTSPEESFAASSGTDEASAEAAEPTVYDSAAEAAQATEVTARTILAKDAVLHLLRRTTFGPTPELVADVRAQGIDAWLAGQLSPAGLADQLAEGVWNLYPLAEMSPTEIHAQVEPMMWDAMDAYVKATLARQIWSQRQLHEVVVDFWANHLNVATPGGAGVWDSSPSYHNDVIRAHAFGKFSDMLVAAMRHPAMLRYLTNDESTKEAVNENLGRELLELHTVGVGSGYTEDDVRNSAYILTGRTVDRDEDSPTWGTFVYDPSIHWTGPVRVLEFQHENASAAEGMDVGDQYLRYLASHPGTALRIAHKLAVRFVADDPPDALVDRLAEQYLASDTAIVPVLDMMFRSGEFWAAVGQKVRRPLENIVASARVLGVRPGWDTAAALDGIHGWIKRMGHAPLGWRPPDGYPDVYPPWRSISSLLETWHCHRALTFGWSDGAAYVPPDQLVGSPLPTTVGEYVDRICQRLCFQTFGAAHRDALLAYLEADAATPTDQSPLVQQVPGAPGNLAGLVLDSPYFALR